MANSWKRQSSVAYLVKYEDLVQNPAGTLDGILEYLGLETSDPEKADLIKRRVRSE
jgi:Sulfotransferase family